MKRDPLLWGALTAVLVVLASAEYDLARACGFGQYVAAGVPAALDIYAVRALKARRDVLVVVAALIAVNSASHLVTAGVLPVQWPLIVAVSAIAPLVLWRVHRLGEALPTRAAVLPEPPAEPIYVAPEPAEPAQTPAVPQPVREELATVPSLPALGAWMSVAQLIGTRPGTSPEQPFHAPPEAPAGVPEPQPEPAEPAEPAGESCGSALPPEERTGGPGTAFGEHVVTVRTWLAVEPQLTGTDIGERLGKSDGYGRRLRRAALANG
ncbi:hypothetical protein [Streptomyces subrutilus]|uniref:hypothetical protein n=1 Tax=Streptomyces subrutilus TaxID=36818 RepID=UPI002E1678F6|nr:hypothetical protein OG479_29550 [Streptomyces subrutilus]